MAVTKLSRKTIPSGHSLSDFECFGPPALKDGEFEGTMIADFGCFNQDGKDSNKFYHAAVVKSKKTSTWYVYLQWGRTGSSGDFQFYECNSEDEAKRTYAKQCKSKNVSRGVFKDIGGRQVLCGKPGKDCYRVRPTAKRDTGLPDAQNIVHKDTDKQLDVAASSKATKKTTKKAARKPKNRFDKKTLDMLHAMNQGSIAYTRASLDGGHVPTQAAIDEARDLLDAAQKRVGTVGENVDDQKSDVELVDITSAVYGIVPKIKRVGDENWILGSTNITTWRQDLDAYENALVAMKVGDDSSQVINDPFPGVKIEMKHMPKSTSEGAFISSWLPKATGNRHNHVKGMKIKNMWAFRQIIQNEKFVNKLEQIAKDKIGKRIERADYQPDSRMDLPAVESKLFDKTNTAMLFHGTRSVNVPGILREGLRLPKHLVGVAITGAMFGPGSYFADDWKKSDGYTSNPRGYWSNGAGHVSGRGAFMFISDVALGNPYVAAGPRGYTSPPSGYHSVAGLKRRSGVANNEWIVYDTSHINLRYLIEYETA